MNTRAAVIPTGPATPVEQDPRWARVLAHDRSADGAFWYSVATTGIYCPPSWRAAWGAPAPRAGRPRRPGPPPPPGRRPAGGLGGGGGGPPPPSGAAGRAGGG